jgi:hypothetical protein
MFTKNLTKTDVGRRGDDGKKSNQSGVGVSKKSLAVFPHLDPDELNPDVEIEADDDLGVHLDLRFIYFNGRLHGVNSRNEYRITGLGAYFREHGADIGDVFTMQRMSDRSYHLTLGTRDGIEDDEKESNDQDERTVRSSETIRRSREMWMAALYLSRFGDVSVLSSSPAPPTNLKVRFWREAYDLFFDVAGDGRSPEAFRRSLKNARDIFDAHVEESGRTGWRQEDSSRSPRLMGALALEVWNIWGHRNEQSVWNEIQRILNGVSLLPSVIRSDEADDEIDDAPDDDPYRRVIRSIKQRRGQVRFRRNLLLQYANKCAISGHGPDDVLEAAHIEPHSVSGHNSSDNGLLLRADLHTLMDAGRIVINPDNLKVMIHRTLIGTPYEMYLNSTIREPVNGPAPNAIYLRERFDSVVRDSRMDFLPVPLTP